MQEFKALFSYYKLEKKQIQIIHCSIYCLAYFVVSALFKYYFVANFLVGHGQKLSAISYNGRNYELSST